MFGEKRREAGDGTEQAEERRGGDDTVEQMQAAMETDQFVARPRLEHFAGGAILPALHQTARDGLAVGWSDLVEVTAQDRLKNALRGHAGDAQSQGAFDDQENGEQGAERERPDENAGTLE